MEHPLPDLDALADQLDGIDVETLAVRHPGWIVWRTASGRYHARRRAGRFHERERDLRRFAVDAATTGRLAVILLVQDAIDAEQ